MQKCQTFLLSCKRYCTDVGEQEQCWSSVTWSRARWALQQEYSQRRLHSCHPQEAHAACIHRNALVVFCSIRSEMSYSWLASQRQNNSWSESSQSSPPDNKQHPIWCLLITKRDFHIQENAGMNPCLFTLFKLIHSVSKRLCRSQDWTVSTKFACKHWTSYNALHLS